MTRAQQVTKLVAAGFSVDEIKAMMGGLGASEVEGKAETARKPGRPKGSKNRSKVAEPGADWYSALVGNGTPGRPENPTAKAVKAVKVPTSTEFDSDAEKILASLTLAALRNVSNAYVAKYGYVDTGRSVRSFLRSAYTRTPSTPIASVLSKIVKPSGFSRWDFVRGDLSAMLRDLK